MGIDPSASLAGGFLETSEAVRDDGQVREGWSPTQGVQTETDVRRPTASYKKSCEELQVL